MPSFNVIRVEPSDLTALACSAFELLLSIIWWICTGIRDKSGKYIGGRFAT